ncbi:MAG TPA: zinc ribbon domain-containing protein [Solirubrobacteraceae bacterium]|nr:zinc ribbon domain-containing protein [Solirubrobacteraceae bacterium]
MLPLAYFGIESSGLNLAVDLLILFVVVLYLSLIYWTYADARRRVEDPMLVFCATVAALFPFVGTIIYMVLRPPEYLEDVRERELETQAAEARLRELDHELCPYCSYRIESDFVRCPSCLRKLKERCASCARPLDQAWTICPYCEADVPGLAGTRARRRRGAGAGAAGLEGGLGELEPVESALEEPTRVEPALDAAPAAPVEPALASEPAPGPRAATPRAGRTHGRGRPS